MNLITDINFKNKIALIRVDYNVPLNSNLEVSDNTRIKNSLKTINYILNNEGSCILMSHLGRPKGEGYEKKFSFENITSNIEKEIGKKVTLIKNYINNGSSIKKKINKGSITILENLRFYKEEKLCDEKFSKNLASLADVYVNDAFGSSHRKHASTYSVAQYFKEKCIGKLIKKELYNIDKILKSKSKPFTAILGGKKISDKINIIKKLIKTVDHIIIGGAISNTFIKALGGNIGSSLYENDKINTSIILLKEAKKYNVKIHLPEDCIIANKIKFGCKTEISYSNNIKKGMMNVDIGPKSIDAFKNIIEKSKRILWSGPMGVFEINEFSNGTNKIAESVSNTTEKGAFSLIGGGDSVAAINNNNFSKNISFISTGGGSLLYYISNGVLPALKILD
jgi:phosphoglycerate kinase